VPPLQTLRESSATPVNQAECCIVIDASASIDPHDVAGLDGQEEPPGGMPDLCLCTGSRARSQGTSGTDRAPATTPLPLSMRERPALTPRPWRCGGDGAGQRRLGYSGANPRHHRSEVGWLRHDTTEG
jgi:hypothetical protein